MLKNKASSLGSTLQGLGVFDKYNIGISIIFFVVALILPIIVISPLTNESQEKVIRFISVDLWKTSILIILLICINLGMSINSNFKSFFLDYTGIGSEIYARFFQKGVIFILLLACAELTLYFRTNLSQTIDLGIGYYILSGLLILGLIIDFLHLQRNYKFTKASDTRKQTIIRSEEQSEKKEGFKNLFE